MASYASRFLADSFAPFGASQHQQQQRHPSTSIARDGRRRGSAEAPLFFSTIDGEAVLDEDTAAVLPQSALSAISERIGTGFGYSRQHHAGRALPDDSSDDGTASGASHDGLGRQFVDHDSKNDDYHASTSSAYPDPFKQRPGSSSQSVASGSQRNAAHAYRGTSPAVHDDTHRPGWMMYRSAAAPPVRQAVLNNIYEQVEGSYASVMLNDRSRQPHPAAAYKGKGRADPSDSDSHQIYAAASDDGSEIYSDDGEHSPPDFVSKLHTFRQDTDERHRPPRASGDAQRITRPPSDSTDISSSVIYRKVEPTEPPVILKPAYARFPMPTAVYRRKGINMRTAKTDTSDSVEARTEWQDTSLRDPGWLYAYLGNLAVAICVACWAFWTTPSTTPAGTSIVFSPALALLSSIPLLGTLMFISCIAPCSLIAYILFFQHAPVALLRRIILTMLVFPPVALFLAAGWAFSASFSGTVTLGDINGSPIFSHTFLRFFALMVIVTSLLSTSRLWEAYSAISIERSARILSATVTIVAQHPQLFVLAAILLCASLVISCVFVLVLAHILVHGYLARTSEATSASSIFALVPSTLAIFLSTHAVFTLFWTLAMLRQLLKHVVAGVLSDFWYADQTIAEDKTSKHPAAVDRGFMSDLDNPIAIERYKGAVWRSMQLSAGSICAAAVLVAITNLLEAFVWLLDALLVRLRRLAGIASPWLAHLASLVVSILLLPLVTLLGALIRTMSDLGITYSAITGDAFAPSVQEARQLIVDRNGTDIVANRESDLASGRVKAYPDCRNCPSYALQVDVLRICTRLWSDRLSVGCIRAAL